MANISALKQALNQVASERNLEIEDIIFALCRAIESNFQDYSGYTDNLNVFYSESEDRIVAMAKKKVVQISSDDAHEIPLIQAILFKEDAKLGDTIEVDVSMDGDFGRVAALSAKQLLSQNVREKEREIMMAAFEKDLGTIQTAIVQRVDQNNVYLELNKAIVVMETEDRIPNEFYKPGTKIKVYVKDIKDSPKGKLLRVSRSDPKFLSATFIKEIPEIESESISIKSVAREPGTRSKVAVFSNVENLDPLGSCIGQKGMRINAIMDELKYGKNEERVDVILWNENIETFVANALSPAKTIKVRYFDEGVRYDEIESDQDSEILELDGFKISRRTDDQYEDDYAVDPNTAMVIVPDDQLSLAIGKDGQNARLASKLTGVKINIQGETKFVETKQTPVNTEEK